MLDVRAEVCYCMRRCARTGGKKRRSVCLKVSSYAFPEGGDAETNINVFAAVFLFSISLVLQLIKAGFSI